MLRFVRFPFSSSPALTFGEDARSNTSVLKLICPDWLATNEDGRLRQPSARLTTAQRTNTPSQHPNVRRHLPSRPRQLAPRLPGSISRCPADNIDSGA